TAISTSRFHELLASIRSKKLVFFLDSCHSGGICVRKGARDISPEFNPSIQLADGEGRLVIAAAQPDQRSWENEKLGHGIFTYHLIEALSGAADANKDGCVTISEVYNYLGNNVPKTTMQLTGNKQEPLFSGDFKRDFIMTVNYERMADKNLESIKKKNLERLIEWYNNNEISAERFELSSEVIEKNPEKLSDNDKKVSKLVNDLLSDKISISFFNKSVGLITGPSVKKGGEGAEENWKKIIELAHEANDLSRGGNHANAITKWQEILDIEPENRKAMEGLRESERILRQISDLNIYAQRLYDECMYTRALEKWNEVLKIDGYNKIALEGIEKLKNTQRVEKYCSSCGEPNISRDKFCGRCGACLIY
ncbi:MAG: caspase family protein, partial [Candidatus Methanoperedens sp.]|nr:caspase family protein [Candidatus Methanoperedens sp.]